MIISLYNSKNLNTIYFMKKKGVMTEMLSTETRKCCFVVCAVAQCCAIVLSKMVCSGRPLDGTICHGLICVLR